MMESSHKVLCYLSEALTGKPLNEVNPVEFQYWVHLAKIKGIYGDNGGYTFGFFGNELLSMALARDMDDAINMFDEVELSEVALSGESVAIINTVKDIHAINPGTAWLKAVCVHHHSVNVLRYNKPDIDRLFGLYDIDVSFIPECEKLN